MNRNWRRPLARVLLIVAGFYLLICGVMYFKQRDLMYFPVKASPGTPAENHVPEMQAILAKTSDGLSLLAWFAPPKKVDGKIIILFHGNAGNLRYRGDKARVFLDAGYGVYLCEYRGFGPNPGMPSEEGFYKDARAAFSWLKENGYKPSQFVVYGESIGTGVAVQMAKEFQPRELILEAAYSSTADVAKYRYSLLPVDLLMQDRFESADKIADFHGAELSIHGDADVVIPIQYGKRLFAAANEPKTFMLVPGGGHSNLYAFDVGPKIVDWLDKAVAVEK